MLSHLEITIVHFILKIKMNLYMISFIIGLVILLGILWYGMRTKRVYYALKPQLARYTPCGKCSSFPPPPPFPPPAPAPAADTPLDRSNTTTNTNDCSGTWELPPSTVTDNPDGTIYYHMTLKTTSCFQVGKCVVMEIDDSPECVSGGVIGIAFCNGATAGSVNQSPCYRFNLDVASDKVVMDNGTGAYVGSGGEPATTTQTETGLKSLWKPTGTNSIKFCFTSDTSTDLYVNGTKVGSFAHVAFDPTQPTYLGLDSPCITTPMYAKVF
jgi:hypothetical protein